VLGGGTGDFPTKNPDFGSGSGSFLVQP